MTPKLTLTVIVTIQIQRYIFASNRLKEIVGASALLKKATEEWLVEAIYRAYGKSISSFDILEVLEKQEPIEGGADFEIIYCGGGNAKILFRDKRKAHQIIREWSRELLDKAPGLQIAVYHHEFILDPAASFKNIIDKAEVELARRKANFVPNLAELAPPFVVRCPSTGLPAVGHYGNKNERLSAQAIIKREYSEKSLLGLMTDAKNWLLKLGQENAAFPQNLDELGQREGNNFIGIIHADGNFMGEKVQSIGYDDPTMRNYINKIRSFSIKLEKSNREAFHNVLKWIQEEYTEWIDKGIVRSIRIEEGRHKGKLAYPLRPIIMGGDDFTAIAPGAIALQVAEKFMSAFQEATRPWCAEFKIKQITASGGVALVHSHMPFDRAYEMAESLAASAKKMERDKRKGKSQDERKALSEGSWIDWHIATDNELDEIEEMRRTKYQYQHNGQVVRLTRKPYRIDTAEKGEPSFKQIKEDIICLQSKDTFPRNKLKNLLNVAVEGPTRANMALREMKYHLSSEPFDKLEKILKHHHQRGELFREMDGQLQSAIFDLVESLEFFVEENTREENK